jgi:cation transport regulator
MPYATNADLPESVRNVLPAAAQTIFRKAFNAALEDEPDDARATRVAWAAVKNAYEPDDEGMWVKLDLLSGRLSIARAYARIGSRTYLNQQPQSHYKEARNGNLHNRNPGPKASRGY